MEESAYMQNKKKLMESGVREIEFGILEWFVSGWLQNGATKEKVTFYLWMASDYMEHLEKYIGSKNAYFRNESRRNRYESVFAGSKKMVHIVGYMATFLIGTNANNILALIRANLVLNDTYGWASMIITLVLFLVITGLIIWGFKMFVYTDYSKRDELLRKQRDTWIRHVGAIGFYQKEMMGFLWNLDEYQKCGTEDLKEKLFMSRITAAWMKDNKKFQSNMLQR